VRLQTSFLTNRQPLATHSRGVRVMLLTDQAEGATGRRLAAFGSVVDVSDGLEGAVSAILEDPFGYDLFVMDCDGFGGVPGAERAISALISGGARMRIMLVSRDFEVPAYPLGLRSAVCLPEDVGDDSFRIGFDHVLRDRVAVTLN
jgi:hypothetical protein